MNNSNAGLAEERFWKIREYLKLHGSAEVDELCGELGVSGATVRRDLAELDGRGQIRRVHGGAVSIEARLGEQIFDDKARVAEKEKQRIAEAALKLISPNDSIYLDGGSTVLALARLLMDMTKLTVVTNSLRIAGTLSGTGPRMIVVGGELRRISQTFVGSLTKPIIDRIQVDKAFMGTIGMAGGDLTTTDPSEAFTKEVVMGHAASVYVLADSSKFSDTSFVRFGTLHDGVTLVTDTSISDRDAKFVDDRNVKLVKC